MPRDIEHRASLVPMSKVGGARIGRPGGRLRTGNVLAFVSVVLDLGDGFADLNQTTRRDVSLYSQPGQQADELPHCPSSFERGAGWFLQAMAFVMSDPTERKLLPSPPMGFASRSKTR